MFSFVRSILRPGPLSNSSSAGLAAVLAWLVLAFAQPASGAEPAAGEGDKAPPSPYVELGEITVNLLTPTQYLQTRITLKFDDGIAAEEARSYAPVIRNQVILRLSNHKAEDFNSTGDKRRVMDEVRAAVNGALKGVHVKGASEVLLASFVIQ